MQAGKKETIHLLGFSSGLAGVSPACGLGPEVLQASPFMKGLTALHWDAILKPEKEALSLPLAIHDLCRALAHKTEALTEKGEFFIVTGGDHSSALGTWSGVSHALRSQGSLGLIWIDAHMDSHTPLTSHTGRFHGMSLAALLGKGDKLFTDLLVPKAKILPQHLCLIGVRSYEAGEAALLKELGVRVYFMDEVKERGLKTVFQEALAQVKLGTAAYGISLDLDSIDPEEAPGVDVPEPDGLKLEDLRDVLGTVVGDAQWVGAEVVEFNPQKDRDQLTERAMAQLIAVMTGYAER